MKAATNPVFKMLEETIRDARDLKQRSTGELIEEVRGRLPWGTLITVKQTKVRVTHRHYMDNLTTAQQIDEALRYKLTPF